MRKVPEEQVLERLRFENPWWDEEAAIPERLRELRHRRYYDEFCEEVKKTDLRRAVVLMGPRRVGKTVLIHQVVQGLIEGGRDPQRIFYVSVDHPLYHGLGLEDLLNLGGRAARTDPDIVFFDEIQYIRDWERHLKVLVDSYSDVKFVASGSAAAALRLKSIESGAGRFTDFLLPPLTFQEYLDLGGHGDVRNDDIQSLNALFVDYLNYGGYPEMVVSDTIRADPGRYIRSDIIDKVLLRDLPGLYGIRDVQELNALFTTLAYNTAQEVSLQSLSQGSGVAKNTIKRYIEYLESAFLVRVVHRVDRSARRFQRATRFKIYLTNPSVWAALFSPVSSDDEIMGALVETAVFAHYFHMGARVHYARWKDGEIDLVLMNDLLRPDVAVEVKWSDRGPDHLGDYVRLARFCKQHGLEGGIATTRTHGGSKEVAGARIVFIPAALLCRLLGAGGRDGDGDRLRLLSP